MDTAALKGKVLLICSKPPYPTMDGGCKATASMLELLSDCGMEVDVLTFSTYKHPFALEAFPAPWNHVERCWALPIDTRPKALDVWPFLFSEEPYQVLRFKRFAKSRLEQIQQRIGGNTYQIVVWDSLYSRAVFGALAFAGRPKQVLRIHNVEHRIDRFSWVLMPFRFLFQRERDRLAQFEWNHWRQADEIWAMTEADAKVVSGVVSGPVRTLSVPLKTEVKALPEGPVRFFHLGAMDWLPNREGLDWLLEKVWPLVLHDCPKAELHLAGRAFPQGYGQGMNGVVVHGEVANAEAFMAQHHVLVVPVRSGSGVRIKTVEAGLQGRMVVSTPVGAEGLPQKVRENLLEETEVHRFAQAMVQCYQKEEELPEKVERLRAAMFEFAGWDSAISTLKIALQP
jgi:hypothetical protein